MDSWDCKQTNLHVLYLSVQLDFISRQVLTVWFRCRFGPLQAGGKVRALFLVPEAHLHEVITKVHTVVTVLFIHSFYI